MNRIILISMVAASALFANMATDVVKDTAVSKVKTQAKDAVIKQVAGDDPVKQAVAKKVANKVVGEPTVADQVKGAVADKVMGTESKESSLTDKIVKNATKTKEPSLKDKAVDMAAQKVVGSNSLKKAAAKEAVKSVMH